MPRVFCIDWSEDDETSGAREAGWSLHVSREDAARYVRSHVTPHFGYSEPYCVDVPAEVYEQVRLARHGVFNTLPRECPYPIVEEDLD